MTTFYLHLFRENNGDMEYVVLTEEELSKHDIEGGTLLGYHHETSMECETKGDFHKIPTNSILSKRH
jgi:hypothetical protein